MAKNLKRFLLTNKIKDNNNGKGVPTRPFFYSIYGYFNQFPSQFWLLCLSTFLFFTSFNIIIPELPSFLTALGGEDYKGAIIGLFTLSAAFSRPISGKLTDTIGRVPVMIIGAVFSAIAGLLYSFAATVWMFLLIRFIHGFCTGFKPTGTVAYAADIIHPARRGESMAIIGLMNNFGFFLGVGASSLLKNAVGFDGMFISSACLAIASIAVLFRMKETLKEKQPFRWKLFILKKSDVFDKRMGKPVIITLLSVSGFGAMLTVIPDFSVHLGIMNKGSFMMMSTTGSLLVRFFSGKMSDRLGRKEMLWIGNLLWMVSLIILGFTTTPTEFYCSAFIMGCAVGFNSPSFFAWAIDRSDGVRTGNAMSTLFIALELGILYGAFLSAEVFGNVASRLGLSFLVIGIFYLLAFILLTIWILQDRKAA
jgi:MFS family permease